MGISSWLNQRWRQPLELCTLVIYYSRLPMAKDKKCRTIPAKIGTSSGPWLCHSVINIEYSEKFSSTLAVSKWLQLQNDNFSSGFGSFAEKKLCRHTCRENVKRQYYAHNLHFHPVFCQLQYSAYVVDLWCFVCHVMKHNWMAWWLDRALARATVLPVRSVRFSPLNNICKNSSSLFTWTLFPPTMRLLLIKRAN